MPLRFMLLLLLFLPSAEAVILVPGSVIVYLGPEAIPRHKQCDWVCQEAGQGPCDAQAISSFIDTEAKMKEAEAGLQPAFGNCSGFSNDGNSGTVAAKYIQPGHGSHQRCYFGTGGQCGYGGPLCCYDYSICPCKCPAGTHSDPTSSFSPCVKYVLKKNCSKSNCKKW